MPDEFWVNVNHRFAPGRGLDDVRRTFEELVPDRASFEIADFAPSGPVSLKNPLLQKLVDSGVEVRPKQAWTDVARFAKRGVDAANLGPGIPAQAHQEEEYTELGLLEDCYGLLGSFLKS